MITDDFPLILEREAGMADTIPPVAVGFGLYPVKDGPKSQKAGYDIYREELFVRICIPGDKNAVYFQPATPKHKTRFPQAFNAFQRREQSHIDEGMPVEQWAPITRALALTLRSLHIHTVEALASVHDGHIDHLPNGRDLREKARSWLANASEGAQALRAAEEKQRLEDQIAALQAQITALQERADPDPEPIQPRARKR